MIVNTTLSKLRNTALLLIITSTTIIQGAALNLTEATVITEYYLAEANLDEASDEYNLAKKEYDLAEANLDEASDEYNLAKKEYDLAEANLDEASDEYSRASVICMQAFTERKQTCDAFDQAEASFKESQIEAAVYIVNEIANQEAEKKYVAPNSQKQQIYDIPGISTIVKKYLSPIP